MNIHWTRDLFIDKVVCNCNVVPLHNVQAVESKKFYIIGRIIAMSLVQGGESPSCFSKALGTPKIDQSG